MCIFNKRTIKVYIVDGVLGPPSLAPHTWCPCISVVPKHRMRRGWGPLKGALSAQKTLQGSETEMRELLEERKTKGFPWQGVIGLPQRQINNFYLSGLPNIWVPAPPLSRPCTRVLLFKVNQIKQKSTKLCIFHTLIKSKLTEVTRR